MFQHNGNTWGSSGCIERNGYLGSTPPTSKSHHQDYNSVSRESLKTFICDCYWVGGVDLMDIQFSPKKTPGAFFGSLQDEGVWHFLGGEIPIKGNEWHVDIEI